MALPIPFIMNRDINGYNGFGLRPSKNIYNATLTSGSVSSFTVPSTYQRWLAVFSVTGGGDVWVAYNNTAAVPVGNTFAVTTSELNPDARQVAAGDIISAITADTTANISVALYYLPNTQ